MAEIHADAAVGGGPRQPPDCPGIHDRAGGFAIETMGDDIALAKQRQHFVEQRRRLANMDHQRQAGDFGDPLGDFERSDAPGADDGATGADLDSANHIAVGLDGGECPVDVD